MVTIPDSALYGLESYHVFDFTQFIAKKRNYAGFLVWAIVAPKRAVLPCGHRM
jgi:hypothetical protein